LKADSILAWFAGVEASIVTPLGAAEPKVVLVVGAAGEDVVVGDAAMTPPTLKIAAPMVGTAGTCNRYCPGGRGGIVNDTGWSSVAVALV